MRDLTAKEAYQHGGSSGLNPLPPGGRERLASPHELTGLDPRDVAIQLQRQGLVEHCRAGFTLDPTDEARYSLDLDDEAPPTPTEPAASH